MVASKKIKKGAKFTEENIIAKRTGGVGISPIHYGGIVGKEATKDYEKDEIIETK